MKHAETWNQIVADCKSETQSSINVGGNRRRAAIVEAAQLLAERAATLRELAETWRKERDFLATGTGSDLSAARLYDECAAALLEKIETMKGDV